MARRGSTQGLKDKHDAGTHTIEQDEASSIVWGMPGAAVEPGASNEVLPVDGIAGRLIALLAHDPV